MRSICISIVATLALVGTSFAATINVPGDHATIQGAIDASSDGDVIAIAAGTYHEHSLNPNGKAITIGSASGNLDVTIDAQQSGGVFVFQSGEGPGTVIRDLRIIGGTGTETGWGLVGGGIYCYLSNPTISDCTIEGNTAAHGGGIFSEEYSNPTLTDCTIKNNTADSYGGGILCVNSNPTITDCTIEGNTAYDYGGGIFCGPDTNTSISGSQICGNAPDQINGGYTDGGGNNVADECPLEGACCVTSGCTALYETQCAEMGGTWLGEDASCDDCVPAEPTGACCVSSGCVANSNDDCTALGGTWLGEGGSCDDCAPTCQGDTNADGVVDIFDLLKVIDGWGICD